MFKLPIETFLISFPSQSASNLFSLPRFDGNLCKLKNFQYSCLFFPSYCHGLIFFPSSRKKVCFSKSVFFQYSRLIFSRLIYRSHLSKKCLHILMKKNKGFPHYYRFLLNSEAEETGTVNLRLNYTKNAHFPFFIKSIIIWSTSEKLITGGIYNA